MPRRRATPTPVSSPASAIEVRGARQNNLKGFDLDLPLGQLTVVTGPSGSGKSSFAFDILYAEGQRRYVETFSPYTRQFFDRMDKPQVDEIRNIPPAIAIQQANNVKTTRSTVGTITEINDYLKTLMPRVARAFCPSCHEEVRPESAGHIASTILEEADGRNLLLIFPIEPPTSGKLADFFQFLNQQGYLRILHREKELLRTDEAPPAKLKLHGQVWVVQDRIAVNEANRPRFTESLENAIHVGKGKVALLDLEAGERWDFSTGWHCARCDLDIREPSPGLFSFNHPLGACPKCRGFGRVIQLDLDRALPDKRLSIAKGVVKPFQSGQSKECQRDLMRCAAKADVDVRTPFLDLPKADQDWVLYGDRHSDPETAWESGEWYGVKGFFDWLESKTYKMHVRVFLSRYRAYVECGDCHGGRYQPETLQFRIGPDRGLTLPELNLHPIDQLIPVMEAVPVAEGDSAATLLKGEILSRLRYMTAVGLGYLTLDRPTRTLSGGELERVNLTTCLGASLVNTLFVLDEPSVGLHPRDTGRLIEIMLRLREKGNTLVVVEHEESVIRAADNLVDIGPGRGETGGELVYTGELANLEPVTRSLTSDYLYGRKTIPIPKQRREPTGWCSIRNARENNLRGIDVELPRGVLCVITGVSGSGKSTLVHSVFYENVIRLRGETGDQSPGACDGLEGTEAFDRIVMVDQSPLSKTPRSTPALYLGVFDRIRELFAGTPDAKAQALTASAFSFNSGIGRCERCSGLGFEKIEMQFLSDLFVRCSECEGKRFQPFLLKVLFQEKSIDEVLDLTIREAIDFFGDFESSVTGPLQTLDEVGLGYLKLGQPLNTLSGGESQRLKLVSHLIETRRGKGEHCFIFDEPSTGLHFDDVALLLRALGRLVEAGHTVLVVEHNLEIIKSADYLIDLGPEAGDGGGMIVATGPPEAVAKVKTSHTGQFLRGVLKGKPGANRAGVDEAARTLLARVAEEAGAYRVNDRRSIQVRGAREHNLKNFDVEIPREQLVVVTGLSGSGKSTLAFDILFAEGQRRFLDSMSTYARQFVEQMERPDIDFLDGLPPTVAIEQRLTRGGGKSTVATVTEIWQFLRLLYAKTGTQFCPKCEEPVERQSTAAIVKQVETAAKRGKIKILATLIKARKGFHTDVAKWAEKQGFETLLVDGQFMPSANFEKLERFREHTIDAVVAEITPSKKNEIRLAVERALKIGKGSAKLVDHRNMIQVLSTEMSCPSCGMAFDELDPRLFSFNSRHGWCESCRGFGQLFDPPSWGRDVSELSEAEKELYEERMSDWSDWETARTCPDCEGDRINERARHVRIEQTPITGFSNSSVHDATLLIDGLKFDRRQLAVARDIVSEIRQRLVFMEKVGLGYLTLDRSARTLSGGESQRIRLAAQLGSNLQGVLYVLDEPTIGLHPRDNDQLLDTLAALKARGNSLVVVEHDDETMRRADHIIDLGPGAGSHGGQIVAQGPLKEVLKQPESVTGRSLSAKLKHPLRGERRPIDDEVRWLKVEGARANNLKSIDIAVPLERFTVLTGVSGSGKSTLMRGVLTPVAQAAISRSRKKKPVDQPWEKVAGFDALEAVYEVDQSPIGKTSRSTPATYVKVWDEIRKLFATVPLARMRGYQAGRFSFNSAGGRCDSCSGQGAIKLEMNFLPSSYVPCADCRGKRFNAQTLEVEYQGKTIADILDMTIEEAADFFQKHQKIGGTLQLLRDTGLGYLKLGQSSPTLSGGEAQRIKLVTELTRGSGRSQRARLRGKQQKTMLYLLEEPTIGLHLEDVKLLLNVVHRLVDDGHSVVVIEHHTTVMAEADYLIDMGPEAGADGGEIVVAGSPEEVARCQASHTAKFLRGVLPRQRAKRGRVS